MNKSDYGNGVSRDLGGLGVDEVLVAKDEVTETFFHLLGGFRKSLVV